MKVFFTVLRALLPLAAAADPAPVGPTAVNLQAQSTREVQNDLMHALMRSEREDKDAARAADLVNKSLSEARSIAKKYSSVLVESCSCQTYPIHERDGRNITGWRVRAELRSKGRDFSQLTTLIAALQSQMQFNGLEFTVSPETRRAADNALIAEAVGAFRQRAALAQAALQAGGYTISELNINTQEDGLPPRPMMRNGIRSTRGPAGFGTCRRAGHQSRVTVDAAGSIALNTIGH